MHHASRFLAASTLLIALILTTSVSAAADWPQFRGHGGRSVADEAYLPTSFSDGENLAWTNDLPGQGVSCPIVVGGRVIVTASSGVKQDRLHVLCFDAPTGELLWERQFWATGRTLCHPSSAVAAPTPACDGQRIFAFYSSNDLFCLDLDGKLLWARGLTFDYPTAANDTGMASSPVVAGDTVVTLLHSQGESFALGMDAETGETRWRVERESIASWTTPAVLSGNADSESLVLLQSPTQLTAHDARSGETRWTYSKGCQSIPSLTVVDDTVYVPSEGIAALRVSDDRGQVDVLWKDNRLAPGNASQVVYRGRLYTINGAGVLTCVDAATGEILWRLRLKGSFWATPIAAAEHLYCVNQDGLAQVVALGDDEGEVIATHDFGETIFASPAAADGALYFRGKAHLWKVARP